MCIWCDVDWIYMSHGRAKWQAFVNTKFGLDGGGGIYWLRVVGISHLNYYYFFVQFIFFATYGLTLCNLNMLLFYSRNKGRNIIVPNYVVLMMFICDC